MLALVLPGKLPMDLLPLLLHCYIPSIVVTLEVEDHSSEVELLYLLCELAPELQHQEAHGVLLEVQ